ncbi:MAG TPA: SurA N-terminal domain-containing protein [Candidatus Acidoferrum sp.]|nr:SurA N-terminal domain-containing protein [Candidatus Acidoferrum sp.]
MLQKIRDKTQGLISNLLMGVLILVFALWGVDTLIGNIVQNGAKLTVNGDEIPTTEIDKLAQRKAQEAIAQMGNKPDLSKLDEAQFRESAVNELIQRKLLEQAAKANGLGVLSDAGIKTRLADNPDFQIDGKYDAKRASLVIQNMGLTPTGYFDSLRQDAQLNQQLATFTTTGFTTPDQLSHLAALVHQKRSLRYLVVPTAKFADAVTISDQDIQDYYQQHQSTFQQEEQVSIEYLELDKNKLADSINVTDEQAKAAYQDEVASYKAQTERRASHILLQATTDQELADARKKATEIKAKLDAGEDFGKLAAQYSQDTGSAKQGGDVGYTTGNSFSDSFEKALQGLALNQVSGPVQSEFGIHLIKLTEIKETTIASFEARKAELLRDLKQKAAETAFKSKVEELKTLAFESPDLKEAAGKLQLAIQTTGPFTRSNGGGIAAEAAVREGAFKVEVKDQGLNSEVITLGTDRSVVLRVTNHQPAQVKPLEVVRGEVEVTLRQQKAAAQAKTLGESILDGVKKGASIDSLLATQKLTWVPLDNIERAEPKLNPEITNHVFAMARPETGKTAPDGFALRAGDYAVVELTSVTDGTTADMKEAETQNMSNFMTQAAGANDFTAYMKSIEARAKIKGKETQLAAKDPTL